MNFQNKKALLGILTKIMDDDTGGTGEQFCLMRLSKNHELHGLPRGAGTDEGIPGQTGGVAQG